MRAIKSLIVSFVLLITASLLACNEAPIKKSTDLEKVFPIGEYNVSISFPENWTAETVSAPFDLQCSDGNSYASVFVYYKIDLAEGQTALDLFEQQNSDILGKRSNVKIINAPKTERQGSKQIHSALYSAEKDGSKNYYYCNLIEFGENSDRLVWIMFTALPSYALTNKEEWKKIVLSTVLK